MGATGANGTNGAPGATGPAGPQGATGASGVGASGPAGARGNTVLAGSRNPLAADGVNGDFWINTATNTLYGPKALNAWPSAGTVLVGPQGPQGVQGVQGPQGPQGVKGDTGEKGATSIFGVISFVNASAKLKASDRKAIQQAGIKQGATIVVSGYTSKAGSAKSNQVLSKQRADSIAKEIRAILPKVNVRTIGYGAKVNKACTKLQNRCVVISVTQPANS